MLISDKIRKIETKEISAKLARWEARGAEAIDDAAWAAATAAAEAAGWVIHAKFYARLASKLKELTAEDFSYRVVCGSRDRFEQLDDQIKIGCISESKTWWLKNYKEVGKKHGYTEEEIAEYGNYIKGEKSC